MSWNAQGDSDCKYTTFHRKGNKEKAKSYNGQGGKPITSVRHRRGGLFPVSGMSPEDGFVRESANNLHSRSVCTIFVP